MINVLVVAHNHLASALLETAETLTGPQENLSAINLLATDSPTTLQTKITRSLDQFTKPSDTIILVDLFGGTPSNEVFKLTRTYPFEVITGVNLIMLLEILTQRHTLPLKELANLAVTNGRKGILRQSTLNNDHQVGEVSQS